MSEWKEYKLRDVADRIGMGPFGSNIRISTFVSEGIPVISGTHLRGIRLEDKYYNFVTVEHANKLQSANVYRGDVIFTHAGNIGQVAFIPNNSKYERYIISQRQFYLRCRKNALTPEYLTYYFKSDEGQYKLLANANQTGVPSLAQPVSYLKTIEIPLPPLPEQRAIAGVLSSLDDKIDLIHRQNKTLEGMAESLWRKMFVEETDPGWEKGKLGDEMNITMGQSPPGKTYNEEKQGIVFFQGRAEFDFRFPQTRLYCTEPKRFAKKGDTLVSVRAPVGDINMAYEDCCIGRGLAAVRHKKDYTSYTFYKVRSLKDDFDSFEQQGTVFGAIGKDDFNNIDTLIPSERAIQEFEHTAKPIDDKIFDNSIQIRTLSRLRDTLLPKLMSGEVRVKL